ncbi:dihydrofolate reductase family protein [Brachybacterium sp. FME24]|uniref:dihydrofolate reductase family protein n=1 Tax=Brachybacterium sp. FME24 TaxID=2742605 RepID=UPI0018663617|nr:dihydrofolate reductase family protein [Brachybacterium sp. FME24]
MHLLLRDGALLPAPMPLPVDAAGARALAELYAVPALPAGAVHVRAMMNTTLDGAIRGPDGTSGPLRNPDDSFVFDVLRALTDVVLVGAATVRAEDYRAPLGRSDLLEPSRRPGGAARPALAIWSNSGQLPSSLDPDQPTYLIASPNSAQEAGERAGLPPEQVIPAATATAAIRGLAERGLRGIQAEGGPSALGRLAAAGLLDELCFSTTHRTVGGSSSRVLVGEDHAQAWEPESLIIGEHATISRFRRTP